MQSGLMSSTEAGVTERQNLSEEAEIWMNDYRNLGAPSFSKSSQLMATVQMTRWL
jgi:hypothetical protein